MTTDDWFLNEIADLKAQSRFRTPQMITDISPTTAKLSNRELTVFCSNDYLNLRWHPTFRLVLHEWQLPVVGAGASRMVSGDVDSIREAEHALCNWLQLPASLLFSSGYAANVGAIGAIAGPEDVIFSDALNHASIVDGCRLSRAKTVVYQHRDTAELEHLIQRAKPFRRGWIVTESVFSMDGDLAPLVELRALADLNQLGLYVDEAHSLGIFGDRGRGLLAASSVHADVLVGTFGKSLGVAGAFVAGSQALRQILWNKARSFVFSTGINVAQALLNKCAVGLIQSEDASRTALARNVAHLTANFAAMGTTSPRDVATPIFPVLLGSESAAVQCSEDLRRDGFFVSAIRPPTVPRGTSRLRITVTAGHTGPQIDALTTALESVLRRTKP